MAHPTGFEPVTSAFGGQDPGYQAAAANRKKVRKQPLSMKGGAAHRM